MKRILSILLVFVFIFALVGCSKSDGNSDTTDTTESQITPLLYKVTDSDGSVVWLFGSIHLGSEEFYPLPQYVTDAFENSDALAVEFDVVSFTEDISAQTESLTKLVYTDGSKITDHISQELYDEAVDVLTDCGVYYSAYDYYMPSLWSSLIDSAMLEITDYDSKLGIDMYMLTLAHESDMEIIDIESSFFQSGMLADFSVELQTLLLEESIAAYNDPEQYKEDLAQLVDLWCEGDEVKFAEYLQTETEFESDEEEALYNEYNKAMLTDRNINMADFAQEALEENKEVFICVGAAHIVGEGAIAQLLEARGYTVETVR